MKLGAQLYSLRDHCDTPEKVYDCFKNVKEIGYDMVQVSGICSIEAERLASYVKEFDLPVGCTHRSFDEIVNDTKKSIEIHKTIGCDVIGIGAMPDQYRETLEGVKEFHKLISEPIKMIRDAGLKFAYHNHAFEFNVVGGVMMYDYLINEIEGLDFIHDVYWSTYAGADPAKYIEMFAKSGRMQHVHFKDMLTAPQGAICPCGDGIIDFVQLNALCDKLGIENVYVEQDNAPDSGDSMGAMRKSFNYLKPIVKG